MEKNQEQLRFKLWIDVYLLELPKVGEVHAIKSAKLAIEEFDKMFNSELPRKVAMFTGKDGYNWESFNRTLYVPLKSKALVEKLLVEAKVRTSISTATRDSCYVYSLDGNRILTVAYNAQNEDI